MHKSVPVATFLLGFNLAVILLGCNRVGTNPAEDPRWLVSGFINDTQVEIRSDGPYTELVSPYAMLHLRRDVCAVWFDEIGLHTIERAGQWQYEIIYTLDEGGDWSVSHRRATVIWEVEE